MIGEVSMDLLQPDMMAEIVDKGVLGGNMGLIISVGIKMILTVIGGGMCGILCGVFANIAAQGFGNDLRKDLFSKIMNLSFQDTDKISTGSLVTRLTNDVTQVQQTVTMTVRGLVRNSVMFLGGILMLYRQSPRFAAVATCGLPFVAIVIVFFLKKTSPLFAEVQKKLDSINHIMQENVAGARVVKAFVKEDYEEERFGDANDALCRENLRVQSLLAFMSPCMNIVLNACVVAVIAVGGYTVKSGGDITPGNTMAAITYLAQILHGVTFMANIFQTFSRSKSSADRINEVLRCGEAVKSGKYREKTALKGSIEFKNVDFSYPESDGQNVLENISFSLSSGETLGIIGATGSGKSTLVNLIPRFFDVTGGQILVDGVDVREYELEALREKIAIVLQKSEMYSRSIEENISWSRPNATPWEIKKAAETAQADEFICTKANGYYTLVSEGGHSLSGGQKQRISIARALLKDSEILIFDDATSALDLKTEADFFAALKSERPDAAKIIIAQRIATVKNADRIAVLDNGKISAIGTHKQLLELSELYRDIYNSQLKADSAYAGGAK